MPNTMTSDLKLGEVHLKVSNLDRSVTFYEEIVGLKTWKRDERHAFMTANGTDVLLVLEEIADASITLPGTTSGLYHFALLLPSRRSLGIALRRLHDKGIRFGQADHLVSEALYISDPDHNGIEIYRDRPRESWQRSKDGQVKMASDPLDIDGLLAESKDSTWQGLPPDTIMGHVHLHVSNLAKSKEFYCDLLGFDLMLNWPGALFISVDGYHHHLALNTWAGEGSPIAPANGIGIGYYTMIIPNEEVLSEIIQRLKEKEIAIREQGGSWYVKDPSGIEIKMCVQMQP